MSSVGGYLAEPDIAWVEAGLAVGSRPYAGQRIRLAQHGIRAVVVLYEPDQWELEDWRSLGVNVYVVPTPDMVAIPPANFDRVVEIVSSYLDRGCSVLLHCLAGVNRAPVFAAAVLCVRRGLSADDAIGVVRRVRPQATPTAEQIASLRRWVDGRWPPPGSSPD